MVWKSHQNLAKKESIRKNSVIKICIFIELYLYFILFEEETKWNVSWKQTNNNKYNKSPTRTSVLNSLKFWTMSQSTLKGHTIIINRNRNISGKLVSIFFLIFFLLRVFWNV